MTLLNDRRFRWERKEQARDERGRFAAGSGGGAMGSMPSATVRSGAGVIHAGRMAAAQQRVLRQRQQFLADTASLFQR